MAGFTSWQPVSATDSTNKIAPTPRTSAEFGRRGRNGIRVVSLKACLLGGGWFFGIVNRLAARELDCDPQHGQGNGSDEQFVPAAGLAVEQKRHMVDRVPSGTSAERSAASAERSVAAHT